MATMSYTLGMAARATGSSKSSIYRAIKAGRISAGRTDAGQWDIDPAALHRVFPLVEMKPPSTSRSVAPYARVPKAGKVETEVRIVRLQAAHDASTIIIELLRQQLDETRRD